MMKILRNSEIKKTYIAHLIITLCLSAVGLFFGIATAVGIFVSGSLLFCVHYISDRKRYSDISKLCDSIDKILLGDDSIRLADFQEGELSILRSEIQKMTVRLREQNNALKKDKIVLKNAMADISHQLRTPLTSMNLIVTLLGKQGLTSTEQAKYSHELIELLNRTEWLIDDILKLSQFDAGVIELKSDEISVSRLIKSAVSPLEIQMELRNIKFICKIEEIPEFIGDFKWSCEALTNILKNCMEHSQNGSEIFVKAIQTALYTEITVCDSGSGISPKDLPHIFERFYRSENSQSQGFGIGLALARQIITSQDGTIKAENRKHGGTKFIIKFYKSTV
ncbi:MAG: sensor histidine kinase [Hominimerdicola sp.]